MIYGVGASYIHKGDTLIYCDLARWKIQLRYRKCTPNFKQDNDDEDVLKKIKRGFFIENEFEPYTVHYAETFIVPANVKEYTIRPLNDETIKVIKAYVRN